MSSIFRLVCFFGSISGGMEAELKSDPLMLQHCVSHPPAGSPEIVFHFVLTCDSIREKLYCRLKCFSSLTRKPRCREETEKSVVQKIML